MLSTTRFRTAARVIRGPVLLSLSIAALSACSPALNWRDVQPKGLNVLLTFPCKTQQIAQGVQLAGESVRMSMTGCVADDMTFALAHARLPTPAKAALALAQMHQAALANVHGRVTASTPVALTNATPGLVDARDLQIDGQAPDGKAIRERVLLFGQGGDVYQLTALGPVAKFKSDAAQTFAESVKLSPSR